MMRLLPEWRFDELEGFWFSASLCLTLHVHFFSISASAVLVLLFSLSIRQLSSLLSFFLFHPISSLHYLLKLPDFNQYPSILSTPTENENEIFPTSLDFSCIDWFTWLYVTSTHFQTNADTLFLTSMWRL